MHPNNDFIYEAVSKLEQLLEQNIEFHSLDGIVQLDRLTFAVEAKASIRNSNHILVLKKIQEKIPYSNHPIIVISQYISKEAAKALIKAGVNFLDCAGNAYIKHNRLFIFIEGQKKHGKEKINQSRAFQETGIKIIFGLLSNPEFLAYSFRQLAELVDVSIGSVSNVMSELEDLDFLIKNNDGRKLKNKEELLERWIIAFNDTLRPRILRKKMRFTSLQTERNWLDNAYKNNLDQNILWGGEPGASIITGHIRPENFIIYSNGDLPVIAKTLQLIPDENGNVEILKKFWNWNDKHKNTSPPLLIYADLMNSGFGRNIEIANQILNNELQHIQ